jgi:hypothetical protein
MSSIEQAQKLRAVALGEFARRESALKDILVHGPRTPDDYAMTVSCVAFALAELQVYKASQSLPPHGN